MKYLVLQIGCIEQARAQARAQARLDEIEKGEQP